MAIEKFRRVIWRLEEIKPNSKDIDLKELRKAIMHEIGTDGRTIVLSISRMIELGYLKRHSRWAFTVLINSHDLN